MTWGLDPEYENDLARLEGFWELYELDEARTLARFGTAVQVGPALPGFVQDLVTRKKLPASIDQTRQWVDSLGLYRP
jgi:hypothetical protein